jgi:hypothetical protein
MLARAENFDQWNSRVPNAIQPNRGEAMADKKMRGERAEHQ